MKEREEARDNKNVKEKHAQEMPEGRLCEGQLGIVLEKDVEQSSKGMQLEDQLDAMEAMSNQGINRRTGKQLKAPVIKKKSL